MAEGGGADVSNDLLSIVVVHYDIPREFPRTLYSLSPAFQRGIDPAEYEVIVVDNGSRKLPKLGAIKRLGLDVHLITVDDPQPSPAHAINIGLNASCGRHVGVMIDGARLASPGLLSTTRRALSLAERTVVGSRGRYLGPKVQRDSMAEGYTRQVEDELLESIDWTNNGYGLFDISVFDESSGPHWFKPVAESNSIFMSRHLWRELGGYSELFTEPGGGYVNLDTWRRACLLPEVLPVVLLGEATFHQLHGGVATNVPKTETARMRSTYADIRGEEFSVPPVPLHFWGSLTDRPPLHELGLTRQEHRWITRTEQQRQARRAAEAAAAPTSAERMAPAEEAPSGERPAVAPVRSARRRLRKRVNAAKRVLLSLPGARRAWNAVRRRTR